MKFLNLTNRPVDYKDCFIGACVDVRPDCIVIADEFEDAFVAIRGDAFEGQKVVVLGNGTVNPDLFIEKGPEFYNRERRTFNEVANEIVHKEIQAAKQDVTKQNYR